MVDRFVVSAEERGQFVLEDFDDLLTGRDALENLLAEGTLLDLGDEVLGDGEVNVGIEQSQTDLAQGVGNVRLGEPTVTPEVLEGLLKLVGEIGEHAKSDR